VDGARLVFEATAAHARPAVGGRETGGARAGEVVALVLVWSFPNGADGTIILDRSGLGIRVSILRISSILRNWLVDAICCM
jgi:hypothetical protein